VEWYGLDLSGTGQKPVESSCEHGNELSNSIKCWEILAYLSDWQLLKTGPAQCSATYLFKIFLAVVY
jgi:hypothetical protein